MSKQSEYENTAMMNSSSPPAIPSSSSNHHSAVERTRKFLLIVLIVSLVLSVIKLITMPILWLRMFPDAMVTVQTSAQIGQLIIPIVFCSIGIFFTYRKHSKGLRVFGWMCVISLILLVIAIGFFIISLAVALLAMYQVDGDDKIPLRTPAKTFSILIAVYLIALIATVIIVALTFRLAKLIDGDQRPTTAEV